MTLQAIRRMRANRDAAMLSHAALAPRPRRNAGQRLADAGDQG